MGLLRWLFGDDEPRETPGQPEVEEMVHPTLGPIERDTEDSWRVESVKPLGCRGTPFLSISGDNNGPAEAALATYERLRTDWSSLSNETAELLLELNHNYFSEKPDQALKSAEELWRTAELLSIDVHGEGEFSLTYRFDWQHPRDDHLITVEFEAWRPAGTAIDG